MSKRMVFLRGQTQEVEQEGVKLRVKVIDTVTQSIISDMASRPASLESRFLLARYLLRNVIESVEIDGDRYDPLEIAQSANIAHEETRATLYTITALVLENIFSSEEEQKK